MVRSYSPRWRLPPSESRRAGRACRRGRRFEVYSAQELAVLLGVERQRELMNCGAESCLKEVGAALGADKLFDGSVGALGSLSSPRVDGPFDVVCSAPDSVQVGCAYFGGKLGVMVTDDNRVDLYICDTP